MLCEGILGHLTDCCRWEMTTDGSEKQCNTKSCKITERDECFVRQHFQDLEGKNKKRLALDSSGKRTNSGQGGWARSCSPAAVTMDLVGLKDEVACR